eukprot:gnl/MRDRNA2_/MRDRNA2_64801_c0_seq1.p1 gnl/MRDRNA2_/MRDRNA2_64801_c0~~gnl/MRDRNA2_/MRDRNA2_64801_c0_seq1.p1  ORF type:complete len:460 (+),score=62.46 gnl/MRDRNA2_/MRDRNA2_64801_c0_seq1:156-1382(+)
MVDIAKALVLPRAMYMRVDGDGRSLPSSIVPSLSLLTFGVWYLRNCTEQRNAERHRIFGDLCRLSQSAMDDIMKGCRISAAAINRRNGNLCIYSAPPADYLNWSANARAQGLAEIEIMDAKACAKRFPEVCDWVQKHRTMCALCHCDTTEDCRAVGELVAGASAAQFIYGARMTGLHYDGHGRASGVAFMQEENGIEKVIQADDVVFCCGRATSEAAIGRQFPTIPLTSMRGLSIDLHGVEDGPSMCIADKGTNGLNWQYTPFGNGRARLVGYADFNHEKPKAEEMAEMQDRLLEHTRDLCPGIKWKNIGTPYSCWRPMSPDNLPIVSPAWPGGNVWINCGHGAIGWTLSGATGELAAAGVTGCSGSHDEQMIKRLLQATSVERFSARAFFSGMWSGYPTLQQSATQQ